MDFENGLRGFREVWSRVTGNDREAGPEEPVPGKDALAEFIRGEYRERALYAALIKNSGAGWRDKLYKLHSDESHHIKALELEYYLLSGECFPTQQNDLRLSEGLLSALRSVCIAERERAAAYASAAERTQNGALQALYRKHAGDEALHAETLRVLLERALR